MFSTTHAVKGAGDHPADIQIVTAVRTYDPLPHEQEPTTLPQPDRSGSQVRVSTSEAVYISMSEQE